MKKQNTAVLYSGNINKNKAFAELRQSFRILIDTVSELVFCGRVNPQEKLQIKYASLRV